MFDLLDEFSWSRAIAASAAAYALHAAIAKLREAQVRRTLAAAAAAKRAARNEIRRHCVEAGLGPEGLSAWVAGQKRSRIKPAELVWLSATELLKEMSSGTLSAEYVMRCFIARAIEAGEALQCNAEERFEEALAEAIACDAERSRGMLRGPLHGLPISIKDQIDMQGFDSTCGLSARVGKPREADAVVVSVARAAGAIPFVRTNIPQLMMLPESFNAIWGTTANPYDAGRTSGGSSGGESALVAAGGSPLGFGTDVGGSVRIPAAFTGICAFKPTLDRVSYKGVSVPRVGNVNGQKEVRSTVGPMARSVSDLELMMGVWASPAQYASDRLIPPVPWDHEAYLAASKPAQGRGGRRLKFGYFESDGWFDPSPANARAVQEAAAALRAAGHEVVPFSADEMVESALLFVGLLAADGKFRQYITALEGEALHPNYAFLAKVASLPNWARPLLARVLGGRKAALVRAGCEKSAREFWAATAQRDIIRKRFAARFDEAGLDALLCPSLGLPALPHGASHMLNQCCSYTYVWNNFDMPAGVVPVTVVRDDEQAYPSTAHADDISRRAAEAMRGTAGLPVGVQVVSMSWQDERCLAAMRALERALEQAGHETPSPPAFGFA